MKAVSKNSEQRKREKTIGEENKRFKNEHTEEFLLPIRN